MEQNNQATQSVQEAQEKMSVTSALRELKNLNTKIEELKKEGFGSEATLFVALGQDKKKTVRTGNGRVPFVPTMTDIVRFGFQSILDIISRRDSIKAALVMANATTYVIVGGTQMSVAEAITLRGQLPTYLVLLNKISNEYTSAMKFIENQRVAIDTKVNDMLTKMEPTAETLIALTESIRKSIESTEEPTLVDPNNIAEVIKQLGDRITFVRDELDFIIDDSNRATEIVINSNLRPLVKVKV